ncbi:MAG: AraC family transcriptional regulator [Cellvibrionaceae bacterium]|nr:AraC family transcriptional regulator [Cellvibrionaceae bacterium]
MSAPLINSEYLDGFSEYVIELGGDPRALFREAELTPPEQGSTLRLEKGNLHPFDRHVKLLDLARERLKSPAFCLELARRQAVGVYGPIGIMATQCDTVGEALKILTNHLQFNVQMVRLELRSQGDISQLIVHVDHEAIGRSQGLQDHALALIYNLLRILCGEPMRLRAAYLQHDGCDHAGNYSRYFKCPVGFNHDFLGLAFDPGQLQQPIAESARTLPNLLRQYLEKRHQDELLKQVQHIVFILLPSCNCSLDSVARAIGYSKRTLQRRLREEGTSFQELIDEVRHQLSLDYLSEPHYRLIDVAAVLGYSELSAFTRSFKRWQGISPQQWRQQLRK